MDAGELARASKASCFKQVDSIQQKSRTGGLAPHGRAHATREGSRHTGGLALVASHKISQIHPDAEIGILFTVLESPGLRPRMKRSSNMSMTTQERKDYAAQRKREMNCCQAVLVAFADKLGKDEDELLRLGSGFGAGMGTMEGTCGALIGAIMASSLLSGNGEAMANSRSILPRFKELCGATVFRDIKGIDTGKVLCSCEDCVRNATEIVAEQMNKQ